MPSPAAEEAEESERVQPAEAVQPRSTATLTAASPTVRHVLRDYSYVRAELRRIALVIVLVIIGLLAATAALRWF